MSTTTVHHQAKPAQQGIFNAKAESHSQITLKIMSDDMMRVLFFNRIAQTELSFVGKSELLNDELRKAVHLTADALRQFDMKTRTRLDPNLAKWLSNELSKDKLFDIGQLVELAARVTNEGQSNDYEVFMSTAVEFLSSLIKVQARKKKLNMKKYKALIRFISEELTAESEDGQTSVHYDTETDSLSFRLVQPDAQVPAKLASN